MTINADMVRRHKDKFVEANGDITREWKDLLVFLVDENEKLKQQMVRIENKLPYRMASIENKPQDVWITDGQQQNTNRKLFGQ